MRYLLFILLASPALAQNLPIPQSTHPIDNLSYHLEFSFDNGAEVDPEKPVNFDGTIYEGQTADDCLLNPQKHTNGLTMQQMHSMYWSMRRHIVNKLYFLIAQVNRNIAYANVKGKPNAMIPFRNYDPFWRGDPHHPELIDDWNNGLPALVFGPYAWDNLYMRYDMFLQAQALDLESFNVQGDARGESGFNYWDRIPAHPIADNCMYWKSGWITFEQALGNAQAHCVAALHHLSAVVRRIIYIWPLEYRQNY